MARQWVTDELWNEIEFLLPTNRPRPKGGRPPIPDRNCLVGILFVLRTGSPWNAIPVELGAGSGPTCWRRFKKWSRAGVWLQVWQKVLNHLGRRGMVNLSHAIIDSASVRAVHGGRHTGPNPTEDVCLAPAFSYQGAQFDGGSAIKVLEALTHDVALYRNTAVDVCYPISDQGTNTTVSVTAASPNTCPAETECTTCGPDDEGACTLTALSWSDCNLPAERCPIDCIASNNNACENFNGCSQGHSDCQATCPDGESLYKWECDCDADPQTTEADLHVVCLPSSMPLCGIGEMCTDEFPSPMCLGFDTGLTVCADPQQAVVVECDPGETVQRSTCNCDSTPGASWFCN